jgi:hypothetical protein
MPNREDEFWVSEKEDLRYCSKHKRYYRRDIGCQLCWLGNSHPNSKAEEATKLSRCPACSQIALFLDWRNRRFECLNLRCKRILSFEDFFGTQPIEEEPTSSLNRQSGSSNKIETDIRSVKAGELATSSSQPEIKPVKCPTCLMISLVWLSSRKIYECQYPKCKATFTENELNEINRLRQAEPEGKAWFGNEYYDPKKKKWRKP